MLVGRVMLHRVSDLSCALGPLLIEWTPLHLCGSAHDGNLTDVLSKQCSHASELSPS